MRTGVAVAALTSSHSNTPILSSNHRHTWETVVAAAVIIREDKTAQEEVVVDIIKSRNYPCVLTLIHLPAAKREIIATCITLSMGEVVAAVADLPRLQALDR